MIDATHSLEFCVSTATVSLRYLLQQRCQLYMLFCASLFVVFTPYLVSSYILVRLCATQPLYRIPVSLITLFHRRCHKEDCARAVVAIYIESLVIALYSSPVILHLLRVLLALKVGLDEWPLPLGECRTAFIREHINLCDDDDKAA
jgi:hypothetical protein